MKSITSLTESEITLRLNATSVYTIGTEDGILVTDSEAELIQERLGSQVSVEEHKGEDTPTAPEVVDTPTAPEVVDTPPGNEEVV